MTIELIPTEEQEHIIDLAEEGKDLVINAFAGASKTTILTMVSKVLDEYGGATGTYLAFNKVTALEGEKRFPTSVDCRTVHSLAYRSTPKDLIKKLKNPKVFPKELSEMYKFNGTFIDTVKGDGQKYISVGNKVNMINRTIARFCNSADDTIEEKHLCKLEWMYTPIGKEFDFTNILQEVLELSRIHWENTIDPQSVIPMTHDAYLKLYSMKDLDIQTDYIMIDENQDSSPVILRIVEAQKKAQKIYVGDRYQAIYGWRGAINAMDFVTGTHVNLTKSFRFGNNVEKIANLLLDYAGNEVPLKGNGSDEGKLTLNERDIVPNCVISRTNAGVIRNIFEFSERYKDKVIGASCDLKEIEKFVFSYIELKKGKRVEHPLLFAFDKIEELEKYCEENTEDMEITGMVKLIEKFGDKALLSAIKRCEDTKHPDIMCTTAHKSKGLEWDNVLISNDFFYKVEEGQIAIDNEELNLVYVACTRAKKDLCISGIADLIMGLLERKGQKDKAIEFGFLPKDDEYGDDDIARATGGVCSESMVRDIMADAKMMYFSANGVQPTRQQLGDFIDQNSKYHGEAFDSWLEQGEGSFGGKILGAGGVLLDDPNSPELTTF